MTTLLANLAPGAKVLLCRQAYVLLSDTAAKVSAWEAYTLTKEHAIGCTLRSNAFAADLTLPKGSRSTPADFAKTGYDIGHMAPDGDMSWDDGVERESFILTNMSPQLAGLNRGLWKLLESNVRAWAYERGDTLLVYVGPVYDTKTDKKIGAGQVDVPQGFFKIVVDTKTGEVLAFLFPQASDLGTDLTTVRVREAEVEKETGIHFPLPAGAREPAALWPVSLGQFTKAKSAACKESK